MKDKLGRDIHKGYKLAFVEFSYAHQATDFPVLQIATVEAVSDFALLLVRPATEDANAYRRVIEDASDYAIVAI